MNYSINLVLYMALIIMKKAIKIMYYFFSSQGSTMSSPQDHEYIVILSCGCCLTLCCLTLIILIWDIFKTKCGRTILQAQVTLILALVMIAVILKIAKFLNQDYFPGISLFLHYLLSCSLWCQINMPAALYAEASWKYCHKEFKAFLISK